MQFPEVAPPPVPDGMQAVDVGRIPFLSVPVRIDGFMRVASRITLKTHGHLGPVPNVISMESVDEIRRTT